MRRLKLTVKHGSPPVLRAAGELDYKNCSKLEQLIEDTRRSASGGALGLALDGLDFVDSSGIRILAKAAHEAQTSGGSLNLVSLTPQLRHALEVTGFQQFFEISGCAVQMEAPVIAHPAGATNSFTVPIGMGAPKEVRERVCNFASFMGFGELALDDIRLAIGEAVSNAVRHGAPDGPPSQDGFVQVQCRAQDDRLRVEICYPSEAFDPDEVPIPSFDPPSEGGMGIYFMKLVMENVRYEFTDGHAVLTMEKHFTD